MKKSLSLLLAIALVFGMFSASAFAATPTPSEAGALLKELEVLKGDDGDLMEDSVWKRQDIVVLLARLLGKEAEAQATATSHTFKDVKAGYYNGFVSWAKNEGYVNGYSATKFGFDDELTVKDFSAIVLRALGTKNDATVGEDAVAAGIFPEGTDFSAKAKRGDTFVALVAALDAPVAGTGKTLGEVLNLPGYDKVAVASAAATGVKKVGVTFSKAVDTSKVAFVLKKGTDLVNVTKFSFDDAKKVATLETPIALAAGDYTVTVSGIELATGKDVASFTVTGEAIASVWVDDAAYRKSSDATQADLAIKVLNQYGDEFSGINDGDIQVTPAIATVTVASKTKNNITLAGVGDKTAVSVTVVETQTAKVTTKEVAIRNAKTIASVTLSAPEYESGKTVYESGKTYKATITAKDQYGNDYEINSQAQIDAAFTIIKSADITSVTYANEKNKLNIAIGNFTGPKTLSVQAIVNATGNNSKIEIAVNGAIEIAEVTLVAPTGKIGLGSAAKIELQAKDQYGNAMTADKIVEAYGANKLTVSNGNASILTVAGTAITKDGDKAVVNITGAGKGTANLTVTVNSTGKSSTLAVTIVDAKYAQTVTLVPDFTKAVYGASITLKATFVDQYGDKIESDAGANIEVTANNDNFGDFDPALTPSVADLVNTGVTLTAGGHDKSTTVTVKLYKGAVSAANLVDTKTVTVVSAKSDEALTYVVEDLGTISDRANGAPSSVYAKEVKVSGKDASGTKVALKADAIIGLTSSASSVVVADFGTKKVAGVLGQEGDQFINVTIAKQDGTPTVVAAPVKVSKAAPVAVSVTAKSGDDAYSKKTITAGAGAEIADVFAKNSTLWFEVKDQFGTTALGDYTTTIVYVTAPNGAVSALTSDAFDATAGAGTYKLTAIIGDKQVVAEIVVEVPVS